MTVKLVYSPRDGLHVPSEMGTPAGNQLQGCAFENLVELAGRVCYDSLGKGRNSRDYHRHILDVWHGSVWEHVVTTIRVRAPFQPGIANELMRKPGVWAEYLLDKWVICLNLRAMLEWKRDEYFYNTICNVVEELCPMICEESDLITDPDGDDYFWEFMDENDKGRESLYISLYMTGSRGFSHEQVRHHWQCAVSQRSTRCGVRTGAGCCF
jgi:hypothetical protein